MRRRDFLKMFGTVTVAQALGLFGPGFLLSGCSRKAMPTTPDGPPTDEQIYDWFDVTVVDAMTNAPIPGVRVDLANFDLIQSMACCGTTFKQAVVPYGQTDGAGRIRVYISRGPDGVPLLWPRKNGTWKPPHGKWINEGPNGPGLRLSAPGYFTSFWFMTGFLNDPKAPITYENLFWNKDNERGRQELFFRRGQQMGVSPDDGVPLNIHDAVYVRLIPRDVIDGASPELRWLLSLDALGNTMNHPFGFSFEFLADNKKILPDFDPRRDIVVYTQAPDPAQKEAMAQAVDRLLSASNRAAGFYKTIAVKTHPRKMGRRDPKDASIRPPGDKGLVIVYDPGRPEDWTAPDPDDFIFYRSSCGVSGVVVVMFKSDSRAYYGKDFDPKVATNPAILWLGIGRNLTVGRPSLDRFLPDRPGLYRTAARIWCYTMAKGGGFEPTGTDGKNGRYEHIYGPTSCIAVDADLSF